LCLKNESKLYMTETKSAVKKNLDEIYSAYAPDLFKICLRYSSSKAEAEDLLHDSFIRIYERLTQYKGKGSFEGWLKRIVVSVALNKLRTNRFTPSYHESFDDIKEVEIETDNEMLPEERRIILDAGIDQNDVIACMDELPAKAKAVFNLYVFEKMKHKEIAKVLDITTSTSKTQLKRARVLLHKQLLKQANMKLKNIKKLSIFAIFWPASEFSHIDETVKTAFDKGQVTPPKFDMQEIISSAKGLEDISIISNVGTSTMGRVAAHLKTNAVTYTVGSVAVATTTAMLTFLPSAMNENERIDLIQPRSIENLNQPTEIFIESVKSNVPKAIHFNDIPVKKDTITVIDRVRVVDSLRK
jgi:RNA polymerase sigma factor (sigma-70 family)